MFFLGNWVYGDITLFRRPHIRRPSLEFAHVDICPEVICFICLLSLILPINFDKSGGGLEVVVQSWMYTIPHTKRWTLVVKCKPIKVALELPLDVRKLI